MTNRSGLLRRAAIIATALGVAVGGVVVLDDAAPARAAGATATPYAFVGSAFGTRIISTDSGLSSGTSAWSLLGCTKMVGRTSSNAVAQVVDDDLLEVGAVTSRNVTYRAPLRGVEAGIRGINRIAYLRLGAAGGPQLTLKGLETRTDVWRPRGATTFSARTRFTSADLALTLDGRQPGTGTPLDDLLDGAQKGIGGVLGALRENGGKIVVPGLGTIYQGQSSVVRRANIGLASGYLMRVVLSDGTAAGTEVQIGRSYSKMYRGLPSGPMSGRASAVQVTALGSIARTGDIVHQPLDCQGTGGVVRTRSLAGVNPGRLGLLDLGAGKAEAWGIQRRTGYGRAWTRATVAHITLGNGALELSGIRGQANVVRRTNGSIATSSAGTTLGSLTINGVTRQIPVGGGTFEIPGGVARVETNLVERAARGIRVTAVKVTLFAGTPGEISVRLGNASAFIKRG